MATNSTGNSATKTVSMDVEMEQASEARAKALGFRSYSAYIQSLVRQDLQARKSITFSESSSRPSSSADTAAAKIPLAPEFEAHHREMRAGRPSSQKPASPRRAVARSKGRAKSKR